MNTVSVNEQVSLIHVNSLPHHSVSTHLTPRCCCFCTLPLSATAFSFKSRLRHWDAGSSRSHGRIEFVILRTGCSPPAALHHASLRRSGIRLQAGERLPGEDFHLSDYCAFRRTSRQRQLADRSSRHYSSELSHLMISPVVTSPHVPAYAEAFHS